VTALAYMTRPTAGATGTARWTVNPAEQAASWLRALRPLPEADRGPSLR
jgi:hypothetical protein